MLPIELFWLGSIQKFNYNQQGNLSYRNRPILNNYSGCRLPVRLSTKLVLAPAHPNKRLNPYFEFVNAVDVQPQSNLKHHAAGQLLKGPSHKCQQFFQYFILYQP